MDQQIEWPEKTREFQTCVIDSTYWNDFAFRDDDIIIGTYAKSGTTWVQQIVAQLIFNGEEGLPVAQMSPWLDLRLPLLEEKLPGIEAQEHRRFIKTHLPVDALVFSPKAKYIYIARDGRDVVWSFHNHHYYMNDLFYDAIKELPYMGPLMERPHTNDVREYYLDWFNKEGFPWWPFWENIRTWWEIRDLPNVLLMHYQDLKDDMEGEMRRIATFLDIPIDASRWDVMVHHCSFDYMKNHAPLSTPLDGVMFDGGAKVFINKGTNGRWRDTLTEGDVEAYETRAIEELGPECARWLATGELLTQR